MTDKQETVAELADRMLSLIDQLPPRQKRMPTTYISSWREWLQRIKEADKRQQEAASATWGFIDRDYACCSKCGGEVYTGFDTTEEACLNWDKLHAFCPHCGARMERHKLLRKLAAIRAKNARNAGKVGAK